MKVLLLLLLVLVPASVFISVFNTEIAETIVKPIGKSKDELQHAVARIARRINDYLELVFIIGVVLIYGINIYIAFFRL